MYNFTFTPNIKTITKVSGVVDRNVIHTEPMFFGADPEFARLSGGPLTKLAINLLENSGELNKAKEFCEVYGKFLVVDTRSHMLMPGMYPAIPGWHCDAYPRPKYGAQPDLKTANEETPHYVLHLSDQKDGVSNTKFLTEEITVNIDPEAVWKSVHDRVNNFVRDFPSLIFTVEDGQLIKFLQPTIHSASACHQKGWRWWFRLSCYHSPPQNSIRKQVQVYYTEGGGW